MKAWLCVVISSFFFLSTEGQVRSVARSSSERDRLISQTMYLAQFASYKGKRTGIASPRLTQTTPTVGDRRGSTYWTNNVTTQSYGQGKVGTFYYWDVQGNLREMKGFVDIAGKNKRGLKLVFPWR